MKQLSLDRIILVLAIFTLITVAYSSIVATTPEIYISIPNEVLKKGDLSDIVTKEDVSSLSTKDDLELVATEASVSELTGIIDEVTGAIEEVKTDFKTKADLIEKTLAVDRNIGGFISGLRDDDTAIVELISTKSDESSRIIEAGNGPWEMHYLTPDKYEVICNASGYVTSPRRYLVTTAIDDLPWKKHDLNFTLYLPEEAPSSIGTKLCFDWSLGGYISGLKEGGYATITVSSGGKTYQTTRGNGGWRINDLDRGNYTVKADASGYSSSPESYDAVMVPEPWYVKIDWTRMDLNFTMSAIPTPTPTPPPHTLEVVQYFLWENGESKWIEGKPLSLFLDSTIQRLNYETSRVLSEDKIEEIKENNKAVKQWERFDNDYVINKYIPISERDDVLTNDSGYRILRVRQVLFIMEDNLNEDLEGLIVVYSYDRKWVCWTIKQAYSDELDTSWIEELRVIIEEST